MVRGSSRSAGTCVEEKVEGSPTWCEHQPRCVAGGQQMRTRVTSPLPCDPGQIWLIRLRTLALAELVQRVL